MPRVINAVRQIKARDFLAPFIFLVLLIPSLIFRLINKIKGRKLWLIAEEGQARDNGYHFYKYVRLNHPNDYCFYAIKKESAGYNKVLKLGNVIKWGSLKHWLYYMSANLNISSQKSGNPCPIFWYVLHVTLGLYRNRVFLQHGITKDDSKWIYYNKTKFKYFICGAKREYDYILQKFGYKKDSLLLTGFPRWDSLKDISGEQSNKSILIMPTWRKWLGENRNSVFKINDFEETDFYKHWNGLLSNKKFIDYIEKNGIMIYFYPHIHMMQFIEAFKPKSNNVRIVSVKEDIQKYFNKCSLMITDYSSVAFDFAYLNKPVIYYQFDYDRYRKEQLQTGYYDYRLDGFGPIAEDEENVVSYIDELISNDKECEAKKFFEFEDLNNSKRVYDAISNNNSKKTIMHVIYTLKRGGAQRYLINLLSQTNDQYKNIVAYYSEENAWADELSKLNIESIRIEGRNLKRYLGLRKIMKNNKVDIVYSYSFYNSIIVLLAAKISGIKKRIAHSHQSCSSTEVNKLSSTIARFFVSILATDKLACSEDAWHALFGWGKIRIIRNGINLNEYNYDESKRNNLRKEVIKGSKDCLVLGTVGRLDDNKNHTFMIDVVKELKLRDLNYKLVIIGGGETEQMLKNAIKKYGLSDSVILLGPINDAKDYYNMFDAFLLTSKSEGLPFVLIEAQANGLPIFASSAISEESKVNSNFVFLDLDSGSDAWADMIANANLTRIVPDAAIDRFSLSATTNEVISVYEEK